MPVWRFMEYITEGPEHRCPFVEWYGTLDDTVQIALDLLVGRLSETDDWDAEPKPNKRKYKVLTKRHVGLCELIFKVGARSFRALGVRRLEQREFIFLGGCEKGGGRNRTIPANAFDDAFRLKGFLELGRGVPREIY